AARSTRNAIERGGLACKMAELAVGVTDQRSPDVRRRGHHQWPMLDERLLNRLRGDKHKVSVLAGSQHDVRSLSGTDGRCAACAQDAFFVLATHGQPS